MNAIWEPLQMCGGIGQPFHDNSKDPVMQTHTPTGDGFPTSTFDTNPPPPVVGLPVGNAPPIPPPGTAVEPGLPPAAIPSFWTDKKNFVAARARWIADDPELQDLVVAWLVKLEEKIAQRK